MPRRHVQGTRLCWGTWTPEGTVLAFPILRADRKKIPGYACKEMKTSAEQGRHGYRLPPPATGPARESPGSKEEGARPRGQARARARYSLRFVHLHLPVLLLHLVIQVDHQLSQLGVKTSTFVNNRHFRTSVEN